MYGCGAGVCVCVCVCVCGWVGVQVTIYHLLKLFQSETDIMLGKKSLVAEFYDELVSL